MTAFVHHLISVQRKNNVDNTCISQFVVSLDGHGGDQR